MDLIEQIATMMSERAVADEQAVAKILAELSVEQRTLVKEVIVLAAVRGYQRGTMHSLGDNAGILADSATVKDVFVEGASMRDLYPEIARLMEEARGV